MRFIPTTKKTTLPLLASAFLLSSCEKNHDPAPKSPTVTELKSATLPPPPNPELERLEQELAELQALRKLESRKIEILRQLESQFIVLQEKLEKTTPPNSLFRNSIAKTIAVLRRERQGREGYGIVIPIESLMESEIQGPMGDPYSSYKSLPYWENLSRGLSSLGYVESGKIRVEGVALMAKEFFPERFPLDAKLIIDGEMRGYFVRPNGDLVVPGLVFYKAVADGKITQSDFRISQYFKTQLAASASAIKEGDGLTGLLILGNLLNEPNAPESSIAFAWYSRGICLEMFKKYEEAIESYTAAINIEPQPHALIRRGLILGAGGKSEEGRKDLEQARSLDRTGEWKKAIDHELGRIKEWEALEKQENPKSDKPDPQ